MWSWAGCTHAWSQLSWFYSPSEEITRWWRRTAAGGQAWQTVCVPQWGTWMTLFLNEPLKIELIVFPLPSSKIHARKSPFIDALAPIHKPAQPPNQIYPRPDAWLQPHISMLQITAANQRFGPGGALRTSSRETILRLSQTDAGLTAPGC